MDVVNRTAKRPLLVWHAGVSYDSVSGTDWHLASAMLRYADVLWVDPPASPVTPARYRHSVSRSPWPMLSEVQPGMHRLSPKALPFHSMSGVRLTTWPLVRIQTRWALERLDARPFAMVASHLDDVLGHSGSGVLNVLYGTDDYVAGAKLMGLNPDRVAHDERGRLKQADLAITVTEGLANRWRSLGFRGAISIIPNGVDVAAYRDCMSRAVKADIELPSPVAGVVGQLSARIDIEILESVVRDGCSLLLVGPVDRTWLPERFARLVSLPNVRWVGKVPFEALPSYLKIMDVGITPYCDSDFNRASFPLKTLEYLAAGLPVVSTSLPAARWLNTDLITLADSTTFGVAAHALGLQSREDDALHRKARMDFAELHSWAARATAFADALGLSERSIGSSARGGDHSISGVANIVSNDFYGGKA